MPYEPPEELIQLKVDWYAAQASADAVANEAPRGDTVIPIAPRTAVEPPKEIRLFSDEQNIRLEAARAEVRRLTMEIHHYPWKQQQDNVHDAEKELNRIALERYQATLANA